MGLGERARRRARVVGITVTAAVVGVATNCAVWTSAAPVESTATYASGDLDPTYGAAGIAQAFKQTFSPFPAFNGTEQTPDGKLLVTATVSFGNQDAIGIARFTSAGTPDGAFGSAGQVMTFFKGSAPSPQAIAIQPTDGRIVVCGRIKGSAKNATYDTLLVRYFPSGSLDSTFGDGGSVTIDLSGTKIDDGAYDVAVQSDGKIVVAAAYGSKLVVARFLSNGALDTSFGTEGKVTPPIGNVAGNARSIVALPNGRILAAACGTVGSTPKTAVVKLLSTGALDSSFGNGGIVQRSFSIDAIGSSGSPSDSLGGMIAQSADEKIIIYGDSGGQPAVWIARLNPNGTNDPSFGARGIVTCPSSFSGGGGRSGVAVQNDGKIVLAGTANDFPGAPGAVRFNENGTLDATFGTAGLASFASAPAPFGLGVAVQPNGRIVVVTAGTSTCTGLGLLEDDPEMALAPDPVAANAVLTLAVSPTHGLDGPIRAVEFWLDFDGDGALDDAIDIDLGAGGNAGGIWGLDVPVIWPTGMHTYFAVVTHADGQTVVSRQGVVKP